MLGRGMTTRESTEEVFESVLRLFDATGIVLAEGWNAPVWHLSIGVPEDWIRDHTRLSEQDPSRKFLLESPTGTWWWAEKHSSKVEKRLEIWRCFRRAGLRDAMVTRLANPFRDNIVFAVYRSGRPFSAREAAAFDLLYPHLSGAAASRRASLLIDGNTLGRSACVEVAFPSCAVVIDAHARRLIGRAVDVRTGEAWRRVERAIAEAARRSMLAGIGGRTQFLWPGLAIDFSEIPARAQERIRFVGLLLEEGDSHPAVEAVPGLVSTLLSPRQLAAARAFGAGVTLPEVARRLGVGVETARSHVRAAYEKLGVRTRAELVHVLRGLDDER